MIRNLCLIVFGLFITQVAVSQIGTGEIRGKITDKETGEALPFVSVVVLRGDAQVSGATTDINGVYSIKPLTPGQYDLAVSFVGYKPVKVTGVIVNAGRFIEKRVQLESTAIDITEFEVIEYTVPLIDKDAGSTKQVITREEIAQMAPRSAVEIAATTGGVQTSADGQISVRGAREENTWYYIDGVKVRGTTRLPKAAIQEVSVMTGGIPANFGDVTGGVISVTTRGATNTWFGSVDVLSSGIRAGGQNIGLDPYAANQVEGVVSGPLLFRKDSLGNRDRSIVGFFLSGNYQNTQDTRPSIVGNAYLTDEARQRLVDDPMRFSFTDESVGAEEGIMIIDGTPTPGTQFVNPGTLGIYNSFFLRPDDWVIDDSRRNSSIQGINLSGRLDFATSKLVDIAIGGRFDFTDNNLYNFNGSLANYQNNGVQQSLSYTVWGRYTQRFKTSDDSGIKNAFYSIQADYIQRDISSFDRNHRDNVFNYGYVGRFEETRVPNYSFTDTLANGVFVHDGFRPIGVEYQASDVNGDLAAVTSSLFDFYQANGLNPNSLSEIRAANGLLNGDPVPSIYGIWNGIGAPFNNYSFFNQSQFRVMANGSVDIGGHAISLGAEFEQLTERGYNLAPGALWTIGRQRTNFHIDEIDYDNLISQEQVQGQWYYTYGRQIGSDQSFFDANLREMLGLPMNGSDFINLDAIDPSMLSLDMFSADELFNQGQSLVNYWGYDHTGKIQRGRPSFDDFFNKRDEFGNFTREVGAFQPIYAAGYIMDKFAFDDIVFNVGVRIDRFDANQFVLKDEYIVGEHYTVGNNPLFSDHPSNIGENYAIYVDRFDNPTEVIGYRNGDFWYNSQGVLINDPGVLRTTTGITPFLVNPDETGENLSSRAFERYTPQVNVMPRISFSFPISDEATFFAHYDILTQRPIGQNRLNPIDYLFIENRTQNIITNPNLRPTSTIDYELGFQQVLTKSSALKISAFYREVRNEINIRALVEAYPQQYLSYSNIDFGTIKGLTLTYDLRRTGNLSIRANYTLQFASATGSNANSGINLANSGEPALRVINPTDRDQRHVFILAADYRYKRGKDYNGPVIGGNQILADAGVNIVANLGTGTPYSQQQAANGAAGIGSLGGATSLRGQINGSRMPSQFTINAQFDKSFNLTLKKGEEGERDRTANLNVYLLINNLLNTQNIIGVYRFTGNPDDDGFLTAAQFQPQIMDVEDETSFRELYSLKANTPFHWGLARTIQLGVRFDF
ncbi:MAG: hypothetical protein EA392_13360 [Cryomorphaceae bacterium]|nr:MAG: hypothetical protein EA392_13360 [Cryomorphaceae bacterium]